MPNDRTEREIPLPITARLWGAIRLPLPLTEAEWAQLIAVLEAFRPAIVRPADPIAATAPPDEPGGA